MAKANAAGKSAAKETARDTERPQGLRVRVREGEIGVYRGQRLRAGAVFHLHDPKLFSQRWMERVPDNARVTPAKENGAQKALDAESADIRAGKDGEDAVAAI